MKFGATFTFELAAVLWLLLVLKVKNVAATAHGNLEPGGSGVRAYTEIRAIRKIVRTYNKSDVELPILFQLLDDTTKHIASYQGSFHGPLKSVQKMVDSFIKEGRPAARQIREHACHCQAAFSIIGMISRRFAILNSVDRLGREVGFHMRLSSDRMRKLRESDQGFLEATFFHILNKILSLEKGVACGLTFSDQIILDAMNKSKRLAGSEENPREFLLRYCSQFYPDLEVCRHPPDPILAPVSMRRQDKCEEKHRFSENLFGMPFFL